VLRKIRKSTEKKRSKAKNDKLVAQETEKKTYTLF